MSLKTKHVSSVLGFEQKKLVCVFDRRFQHSKVKEEWLDTTDLDFKAFLRVLSQAFSVAAHETFVLVTTERRLLDSDGFLRLQNGATLYMLQKQDQKLERPTEEVINFTPHHDTVVESGTYKYYDSEGKKSLPYALADLVDNALTATANNTGVRTIEIRILFDESQGKPAVIVLDNGCGMTSKQLNNWAVYKLSKFTRDSQSDQDGYVRPVYLPRSLNSDISYFGVGGKQAAFYIGRSTRMISKSLRSPDVHELLLSKSLFEKKEKNNEETYSTTILNRRPGDFAHTNKSQELFLQDLIAEECDKESFTAVVITDVLPEHIHFLKEEFEVWTRQLAHIYHYYIHGVDGNITAVPEATSTDSTQMSTIDILIRVKTKSRPPIEVNLRDINTDMQSQYIKAAVSTFEFKACTNPEAGIVEGILRYHPFLYENETYPDDPDAEPDHVEDNDEADYISDIRVKKRKKPIFECFWNGRLIPYTTLSEFDWCTQPKDSRVPPECYHRFSGVLFTDDTFKVTENKLTFIDLETKLKNKDTVFTFVVKGQKQRGNLKKDFGQWLHDCHEHFDRQVKFMNYLETITRADIPTKRKQHPWATFSSVEWHGRVYEAGQYVKTQKTNPIYHGTVKRFMCYGNYDSDGDFFAPGGQVEICLEPKGLHDSTKIVQLSKLERSATVDEIKKFIKQESAKLPNKLQVDWPKGNQWEDYCTQLAGTVLGPIQVQIVNKKGDSISRISTGGQGRKLSVELKLVHNVPGGEQEVLSHVAQHSVKWGFWFKEIENFVELGKYTLYLNTVVTDTNETEFGERRLPLYKLRFTIKEGKAVQFDFGAVNSSLRIGVPFDIPLEMKDIYGHPVPAPSDLTLTLQCRDLDVTYEQVKCGEKLLIKNVRLTGKLKKTLEPNPYDLAVTVEGLKEDFKTLQINLLPGCPHSIHVIPKDDPITVENGNTVKFNVIIQDEAGNTTAHPKMTAQCLVPDQSPASINCSTGIGIHITKPIKVSIVKGKPQNVEVQFIAPSRSSVTGCIRQLLVLPSKQAHCIELYKQDSECLMLKNNEKIQWVAGGVLENLYFKLYDEAGEEIDVTAAVASKMKVNWTGKMIQRQLVKGKLPDVRVPTKVCEEHFYQVSYQDQSISFSFTIVPIPDEAAGIKVTVPTCTARLGEPLCEPMVLELADQYDNVTKILTPSCVDEITAEGEGLDKTRLTFQFQKDSCSVLVTGVCFTAGTPGYREINFTFRNLTRLAKVKMAPGVPSKLVLVSHRPSETLRILNGHCIPKPFLIQLCDMWDNPSPDQRVVVKMCPSSRDLKVLANVLSQPVDEKGQASFKVMCVSGAKGYYQLNFEGIFKKEPIEGPSVTMTVLPDPNKPVSLDVKYDTTVTFVAGELFPVFSVTIISDEGSPITSFAPATVSMLCWKGVLAEKTPPDRASEFQCTKPRENENKNSFHFREKRIPEDVGKYTVQFRLMEPKVKIALYSEQYIVYVVANKPVRLAPDKQPPTQVVSCCQDLAKRILLKNVTLEIVDEYGNAAGQDLNGDVEICIKNLKGESTEHPLFENKTASFKVKLMDGKAYIETLAVMENSPGVDGVTYVVLFTPLISPQPPEPLDSFEFQFSFSHDVKNQEKRDALSKTREIIRQKRKKSIENVGIYKAIIKEHQDSLNKSRGNLEVAKAQLKKYNLHLPENASVAVVDKCIRDKEQEARQILARDRRTCRLPFHNWNIPEVLGKVGHLAFVEDDAAAWVISWQLIGDMNCIITTTTEAAQTIYRRTEGSQEVLPIDGLNPQRPLQPLPHIVGRFDPIGNPVYAVNVLQHPMEKTKCELVFRALLQNTILIDDLDSANKYRQSAVKKGIVCPTILTRQGERITGKGKFGGKHNKAPPRNQLAMFGSPLPQQYYVLGDHIVHLKEYKTALETMLHKKMELSNVTMEHMPEINRVENNLKDLDRQLEDTERQLELQVHPGKRACPSSDGPSFIHSKRARP